MTKLQLDENLIDILLDIHHWVNDCVESAQHVVDLVVGDWGLSREQATQCVYTYWEDSQLFAQAVRTGF